MRNDELLYAVKRDLLSEGSEDFLGLWAFLWCVREILGVEDKVAARAKVIELVRNYLEEGLITPGLPVGKGPNFTAWSTSPAETVSIITNEWDQLPREPFTGDIVWFVTTEKGREWLRQNPST